MKTMSLCIALLVFLFCIVDQTLLAVEFEVDGVFEYIRPETSKLKIPSPREVRFAYRDGQWFFAERTPALNGESLKQLWDDGRYMYGIFSIYIDPSKPVRDLSKFPGMASVRTSTAPSPSAITNHTQIYPSGFPNELSDPEPAMVFYGYASSAYLDSSTNGLLDPIPCSPTDLDQGARRVKANVARNNDSLRLPTSISFFDYFSLTKTTVVFNASNFTNIGNARIPLKVEAVRYSRNEDRWLEKYQFEVRDIKPKCSLDSFTPKPPERAMFQDFRFYGFHSRYVTYGAVTNRWPSEDETKARFDIDLADKSPQ